jgi:hypothetical protein
MVQHVHVGLKGLFKRRYKFIPTSKTRLHRSAIHLERRPVGRGGKRTANISDQVRHFLGRGKPFQER